MDNNKIPIYYTDLSQDELKLLLCMNTIKLQNADSNELQEYYQQKIRYISSLIEE